MVSALLKGGQARAGCFVVYSERKKKKKGRMVDGGWKRKKEETKKLYIENEDRNNSRTELDASQFMIS